MASLNVALSEADVTALNDDLETLFGQLDSLDLSPVFRRLLFDLDERLTAARGLRPHAISTG